MKKTLLASAAILIAAAVLAPAQATVFDRDMEKARALQIAGDNFGQHLAREYRDFFLFEADEMYDWQDADHFAEKALLAAKGEAVGPEEIEDWNIDGLDFRSELAAARAKLVAAIQSGGALRAPKEAAVAQARFDCWVEQQEEGWQLDDIAACKGQYQAAMLRLDQALTPQPELKPALVQPAKASERLVPLTEKLEVFFAFDSADLDPEASRAIAEFFSVIEDSSQIEVVVSGYADRAGSAEYNRQLSLHRAEAVKVELERQGLRIGKLEDFGLFAKGEEELAVQTPDGVPEPGNRRVVLQGYGLEKVALTAD